jgi:hypothetical protein
VLQDQLERENLRLRSQVDSLERKARVAEARARDSREETKRTLARYRSILGLSLVLLIVMTFLVLAAR